MDFNNKRLNVFDNDDRSISCVLLIKTANFEALLEEISEKLAKPNVKYLYNGIGAQITDVEVIRDNDVVYASSGNLYNGCRGLRKTNDSDWVTFNVGGFKITTTKSTLTNKEPESMLARMFSDHGDNQWLSSVDELGAYLIDRNGRYLSPIIDYLRHGELILDDGINAAGVLEEARFFGVTSIIPFLEELVQQGVKPTDYTPITRRQISLALMSTPSNSELRCQGLNFTNADLSKLDLRFVNFKYAGLKGCNLAGANLSNVNFERADLTDAVLDGANMMGVKLLCAQLEGASLKCCNFEDPAGNRANMEGANLKHVNLEGSLMAGVNLRVATLRNSNLKNCDLRGAILAGADLENCDLSGCDLQGANLRGANLKGAIFEMMLNALHMSQTLKS